VASITNAKIEIGSNASAGTSNCVVTCKVIFNQFELNQMKEGLRFSLNCALWGEDLGQGNFFNPDDYIFSYGTKFFPDANPSNPEVPVFTAVLATNLLNEDFGTDEVYGQLRLKNLYTNIAVRAKTNVIRRNF
jgi:hypothetical protein